MHKISLGSKKKKRVNCLESQNSNKVQKKVRELESFTLYRKELNMTNHKIKTKPDASMNIEFKCTIYVLEGMYITFFV